MSKARRNQMDRLPEQIISELAAIGMTRATDILQVENGQVSIRSPEQLGKDQGAAVASVEKTAGGWKIKFYDKLKALELLGDHFGLFDSGAVRPAEDSNLLEAILSSTQERMDVSEIQELQQASAAGDDLVEPA